MLVAWVNMFLIKTRNLIKSEKGSNFFYLGCQVLNKQIFGLIVYYSAIYFANRLPNSKIISIEPEEKNFEILNENIKHYPNIYAINSALWPEEEELYLLIKHDSLKLFTKRKS